MFIIIFFAIAVSVGLMILAWRLVPGLKKDKENDQKN
ncbi:MAG: hypothetical protein ACI8XI_000616 [Woeseiaceae bacterium]|jgi:phosphate/sulfate permease|tara:strand:- start:1904 stop:2014 length:111 start_codon:yes stop_codon:yes gene_type:complete